MSRYSKRVVNRVSRRNVLGAAGMTLGVSALSGTGTARETRNGTRGAREDPYITAHRGFRDVFPQNTIAAVEGSSRLGAERIEIDVEATSDGEIVVFHDARLDDLTDEEGLVAETPAETVLQAEVLDSGETIPTLAETLAATRPSVLINIEFKDSGPLSWEEFAERTLRIASRYPGEYYASSFDPDALRAVRNVDPDVGVAPIFGSNKDENLEIARELDAKAVNPSIGVLDRDLVETAHEEGREVNVWTIDSWREARKPLELGVDGLIADYPHMATFATSSTHS
ncbi:glycerophosphodiester phosphodiesterase [Haladaptatus salinisoli]|uniref:glycerophosphodiester phosphodiesterase n=1 Tax=Haladaptatus salinisoli TaxID=2884876 RepID=UPI001D0B8021|nr:glycerophosphodiester phosphodiesterase [Haladaptatus salinisoli]